MAVERCKSCGRPVVWGKSPTGKGIIMEARKKKFFIRTGPGDIYKVIEGRESHFGNCPDRAAWKRNRNSENKI